MSGQHSQSEPCSKCGNRHGWYEKRICKHIQFFEPDGKALGAGNMERVRGGARRFCLSCNKDITQEIKEDKR